MRRLCLPAALLVVAATTNGCLAWETRLVLAPDGSGSGTVRAGFDPVAAEALRARVRAEAARATAAPGAAPAGARPPRPPDPLAPGWFHAEARGVSGYTLSSVASVEGFTFGDGPAVSGVELAARFEGLEAAARGGLFHGCEVSFERLPKKRWRFSLRPPWMASGPGAEDAFGGVPAEQLHPFAPDLAALAYRIVITFPAPVLETNATLSEDRRTVTFEARGSDQPARVLTVELELPDDEAWPTFRHRPDLAALARRLVVPAPPVPSTIEPPAGPPVEPPAEAPPKREVAPARR